MKATGIIRRMDDLGRVVIPKEIRRTLRLREGDPLELYVDNQGGIVFRKYNAMGDYDVNLIEEVCQEGLDYTAFGIYDRDGEQVIDLGPVPNSVNPEELVTSSAICTPLTATPSVLRACLVAYSITNF